MPQPWSSRFEKSNDSLQNLCVIVSHIFQYHLFTDIYRENRLKFNFLKLFLITYSITNSFHHRSYRSKRTRNIIKIIFQSNFPTLGKSITHPDQPQRPSAIRARSKFSDEFYL